jgi:hypothetical protein
VLKKSKSFNHKGAQALKNSPVGYFSAVAGLQGWHFAQSTQSPDSYQDEMIGFNFVPFEPFIPTIALAKVGFVCFVVKKNFFNIPTSQK